MNSSKDCNSNYIRTPLPEKILPGQLGEPPGECFPTLLKCAGEQPGSAPSERDLESKLRLEGIARQAANFAERR
jgi:hypothetical protein